MKTIKINYNQCKSFLCEIGSKYRSIKSSQKHDDEIKCRAYTMFYDGIFNKKKNDNLTISEICSNNDSLSMWKEYFKNSNIFYFNNDLEMNFESKINNQNYDIIIFSKTNQIDEQLKFIMNIHELLNPGGIIIIENIMKVHDENVYFYHLKSILYNFKNYFFVEIDHVNVNSDFKDNKLFVLIKNGSQLFENKNKITIITPCYRIENLWKLKQSINFDYLEEWIIVYDGKKILENPYFFKHHDKIKEYVNKDDGISGNPQRNFAISKISNHDSFLYYLDDDNIIHPLFFDVIKFLDMNRMYTFNQYNYKRMNNTLIGNNIIMNNIDTAMVLYYCKSTIGKTWNPDKYEADGEYITSCYEQNKNNHIFIDNTLCYYNKLSEKLNQ